LVAVRKDRSRASAQVGFISPLCPGQHRRLRPFSPPCSSLRISFVKNSCRSITGWRLHSLCSHSPMQRHDVENVASAGANPAASTNFRESKPQQTGIRFLPGYGEVATTSGSTTFLPGRLIRRTAPFEGAYAGASPAPAANRSPLAQNQSGSLTNCGRWRI
jgi:hypothetical protein